MVYVLFGVEFRNPYTSMPPLPESPEITLPAAPVPDPPIWVVLVLLSRQMPF